MHNPKVAHGINRLISLDAESVTETGALKIWKAYAQPRIVNAGTAGRYSSPNTIDIISRGKNVVARVMGNITNRRSDFVELMMIFSINLRFSSFEATVGSAASLKLLGTIKAAWQIEEEEL